MGEWPRVAVRDSGTETGDAYVGGWTCVVDMEVLGNLEGLWSIHNNKQQILGFEQLPSEAREKHLIIWSHCSPPEIG